MRSVAELEHKLSEPSAALVADMAALDGDILILGAGGKLGPSLTRLALRAAQGRKRIIAASRFSDKAQADALAAEGATILSADITDEAALARLPDVRNVVFLVGSKFGSTGREADTWYTNAYLPGRVADRFRSSRIVALSTGNVYPFTPVGSGGPTEDATLGPVGEYAMSCLGRERVFSAFAQRYDTPLALIRLNYAVEMRYGVLVDIGREGRNLCFGHGPSGRNGGFCESLWLSGAAIRERYGDGPARALLDASSQSVLDIGAWCEANEVDAWFNQAGYMCVSTAPGFDDVGTPAVEAARALGARERVIAHPEWTLTPEQHAAYANLVTRCAAGEPLYYLLGQREFYGRAFAVDTRVLIPRPETEHLVEAALAWARQHPDARAAADVGSGSGILAVTLACELPVVIEERLYELARSIRGLMKT